MALRNLAKPLALSLKNMFTKPTVIEYPKEKIYDDLPDNFKQGRHIVDFNLCVGCQQCARVCPAECIKMISIPADKGGNPKVNKPLIYPAVSLETCMWCNLCEEICPTTPKAIRFSKLFENADTNKSQLVFHPLDLDSEKYGEVDFVKQEDVQDVIEGKRMPTQPKVIPVTQPATVKPDVAETTAPKPEEKTGGE